LHPLYRFLPEKQEGKQENGNNEVCQASSGDTYLPEGGIRGTVLKFVHVRHFKMIYKTIPRTA
jgi:hypothetical protein